MEPSKCVVKTKKSLKDVLLQDANIFTFGSLTEGESAQLHLDIELSELGIERIQNEKPTQAVIQKELFRPQETEARLSPDSLIEILSQGYYEEKVSLCHAQNPLVQKYCGIVNLGNTCYANVVIQTLKLCPGLNNVLTYLRTRKNCLMISEMPKLNALSRFATYCEGVGPLPSRPDVVFLHFREFFDGIGTRPLLEIKQGSDGRKIVNIIGPQQDAQEFLGYVLDALQNEQEKSIKGNVMKSSSEEGWREAVGGKKRATAEVRDVGATTRSIVSELFQGKLRSILRTTGTKHSVTLQPFYYLQLDISNNAILSVEDAIDFYMEPSYVEFKNTRKQKVLQFEKLPKILIFHLKRFAYNRTTGQYSKIQKSIRYNENLFIPDRHLTTRYKKELEFNELNSIKDKQSYQLFSVVLHHGSSIVRGHYTNYSYDFLSKQWLHFDDENIQSVTPEEVTKSSDVYLLFYVQKRAPTSNHLKCTLTS